MVKKKLFFSHTKDIYERLERLEAWEEILRSIISKEECPPGTNPNTNNNPYFETFGSYGNTEVRLHIGYLEALFDKLDRKIEAILKHLELEFVSIEQQKKDCKNKVKSDKLIKRKVVK